MKDNKKILLIIIVFLIFSGIVFVFQSNRIYSLEKNIKYLCSKKLEGRLTGSEGGKKAEEYLVKILKKIKIEPYKKDYTIPYKHISYDEDKQVKKIALMENGEIEDFVYGIDFIEKTFNDINGEYNINFDLKKHRRQFCISSGGYVTA